MVVEEVLMSKKTNFNSGFKMGKTEVEDPEYLRKRMRWFWRYNLNRSEWKRRVVAKVLRVAYNEQPAPKCTRISIKYKLKYGAGKSVDKTLDRWVRIKIVPRWLTPLFLKMF